MECRIYGTRHTVMFFISIVDEGKQKHKHDETRSIFRNVAIRMGKVRASERANQTVICNQLKANKPGADWTTVAGVRRENGNNNSGSLTAV